MRTTDPAYFHRTDVLERDRRRKTRPQKFMEILPMQLKDRVSGKKDAGGERPCLPEMMKLFLCLNKTEFDTLKCPNEVKTFEKCYAEHMKEKKALKGKGTLGILVPGQQLADMTSHQINTLLKKYPIGQFMKRVR